MTPYDLYYQYRHLDVMLSDWQMIYGIDVHEYRIATATDGDFCCAAGLKEYDKLRAKIQEYGELVSDKLYRIEYPIYPKKTRTTNPQPEVKWAEYVRTYPDLMSVYNGKGSIDSVKQAIRLAVAFGLVRNTVADIQRYCDKNIGLDCSGFARSYFNGNFSTIKDFSAVGRLMKLDDVKTGTALIWKSMDHIALVDKVTKVEKTNGMVYAVDCMVAESTGDKMVDGGPDDGLNYSEYSLLFDKVGDTFNIMRPLAKSKTGVYQTKVYMVNK